MGEAKIQIPKQQASHLQRPLLIWDGNCGFCKYWIIQWKKMTGEKIAYSTYQEAGRQFEAIPTREFKKAVFLIEPSGNAYRGMGAAFRTFTYGKRWTFLYKWYEKNESFRNWCDRLYKWIAKNRPTLYRLTIGMFGKNPHRLQPYWLIYLLILIAGLFLLL